MIPLATPRDGELVNLSQIVRVRVHKVGRCSECEIAEFRQDGNNPDKIVHIIGEQSVCTVYFSDGRQEIYDGDASKALNLELHFLLNTYRQMQQSTISPPSIVTPNGQPPSGGLVM